MNVVSPISLKIYLLTSYAAERGWKPKTLLGAVDGGA